MPISARSVSIVVTAHNYARFLPKCLDSVLSQSYTNYELIVVDDGSTDNTHQVLEQYDSYIDEIVKLDGQGVGVATNAGVRVSSGEYVIRLDADDCFSNTILERLVKEIEKSDTLCMVYPDFKIVNESGELISAYEYDPKEMENPNAEAVPLGAGALFRRKCFDELEGCDERLKYEEDYDFWHRFIRKFKIRHVKEPLFCYRRHGSNKSNRFLEKRDARRLIKNKLIAQFNVPRKNIIAMLLSPGVRAGGDLNSSVSMCIESGLINTIILNEADRFKHREFDINFPSIQYLPFQGQAIEPKLTGLTKIFIHSQLAIDENYDAVLLLDSSHESLGVEDIKEAINNLTLFECDRVLGIQKVDGAPKGQCKLIVDKPAFSVRAGTENREFYTDADALLLLSVKALRGLEKRKNTDSISHILIG